MTAQRRKSEADWAVEFMIAKQEPIFYDDLVRQIAAKMGKKIEADSLSSIYTRINLDNRLVYKGDGYWYFDASRIHREV